MAVATWQNVAVALGRPTSDFSSDHQAQLTYWLNGVELFLTARLGSVGDLDAATVRFVETEVVAAKARRLSEGGASSVTVSVDDSSVTRRFDPVRADEITSDLWGLFTPDLSGTAYTIPVSSPLDIA